MSAKTTDSDRDYDIDSTNEFFVAGWDPYVVGLTEESAQSEQSANASYDPSE